MFIPLSSSESTVNGFTVTIWGATSVYTRIIWGTNSEWIYCNSLGGRPVFIPLSSGEPVAEGSTHYDHMGNQQWMYQQCKNQGNPQWTPYSDSGGINLVLVICMPAVQMVVVVVVMVFPGL